MKVYNIEQFKCHFCGEWFNASSRLPLRLRCNHNVCRSCVGSNHQGGCNQLKIVCPEDLEASNYRSLDDIEVDTVTKHILERLLGREDPRRCNNHLQLIQEYSKSFDELTCQASGQIERLNALVDEIYKDELTRIEGIWTRIKLEINRPLRLATDWKEVVKHYLRQLKKNTCEGNSACDLSQFQHYIDQAKKAHLEIVSFLGLDKEQLVERILSDKRVCFQNGFSLLSQEGAKEELTSRIRVDNAKKGRHSCGVVLAGGCQGSNKENHPKGMRPLKNENLEQIRKRVVQQYHESPKALGQLCSANLSSTKLNTHSRQGEQNKSCSMFDLSRSGNNVSDISMIGGALTPMEINKRPEARPLATAIKSSKKDRYTMQGQADLQTQHKAKSKNARLQEEDSYTPNQEALKEIEELNEEMLLSTYEADEQDPSETTQKLRARPRTNTGGTVETGEDKFSYHEPTEQLREKIARALSRPTNLVSFHRAAQLPLNEEPREGPEVRRGYIYDCETEKHNYAMKMRIMKVQEAMMATTVGSNFIELVNHPLEAVDFRCYLELQHWSSRVQILKFVKCGLQDEQLNVLLNFVLRNAGVHTLVVSNNQLTDDSVDMLLEFFSANKQLRNVYLSRNHVSLLRCKQKIAQLKNHLNIYI